MRWGHHFPRRCLPMQWFPMVQQPPVHSSRQPRRAIARRGPLVCAPAPLERRLKSPYFVDFFWGTSRKIARLVFAGVFGGRGTQGGPVGGADRGGRGSERGGYWPAWEARRAAQGPYAHEWEGLQQGVERPPRPRKATVPGPRIAIAGRRNAWEVGAVTRRLEGLHGHCVAPLGKLVVGGTPPTSSRSMIPKRKTIHE